ncbi:MAG: serine O-acetyltransferase [Pseudomonadota bacterium]
MTDQAVSETVSSAAPPVWSQLRFEAGEAAREEPSLASYITATILDHEQFACALGFRLADQLADAQVTSLQIRTICEEAYRADPDIVVAAERDMQAVFSRDPACHQMLQPFLYFKGFAALQSHRIAHWLWGQGRATLAFYFQSRVSKLFQVDIHPATQIGSGVMLDHATGIVIGETAVIGDDCSILQGVTLGGTGKEVGDRHPKIGRGVLISVGAKVLGNIRVGDEAKIAAGSVVLKDVDSRCTVAGVPARPVGGPCAEAAKNMDQMLPDVLDYSI